jgi:hypothetical protein
MIIRAEKSQASQNIGLIDRLLRAVIGSAMLAGGTAVLLQASALPAITAMEAAMLGMILVSIYPLLTAVVGVDPFYSAAGIRSCSISGKNQCGTFPFQIKAALGKAPRYCETDDEHSLDACHDEPMEHPHHAYWRVDKEPMLYPDDATIEEFSKRERELELSRK